MNDEIVIIPAEGRVLTIPYEPRDIDVPAEWRELEVRRDQMLIASKAHTAGNIIRWRLGYEHWLDNAAEITGMQITSSAADLTVSNIQMLGRHVYFMLTGGTANEQATLTLVMSDNFGNVKKDTLQMTVVPP
jgi:hypothetical protein